MCRLRAVFPSPERRLRAVFWRTPGDRVRAPLRQRGTPRRLTPLRSGQTTAKQAAKPFFQPRAFPVDCGSSRRFSGRLEAAYRSPVYRAMYDIWELYHRSLLFRAKSDGRPARGGDPSAGNLKMLLGRPLACCSPALLARAEPVFRVLAVSKTLLDSSPGLGNGTAVATQPECKRDGKLL